MKSMTKQELADKAGVGRGTMGKWIKHFQKQFDEWGIGRKAKLLPPKAVKLISDYYCIDVD